MDDELIATKTFSADSAPIFSGTFKDISASPVKNIIFGDDRDEFRASKMKTLLVFNRYLQEKECFALLRSMTLYEVDPGEASKIY